MQVAPLCLAGRRQRVAGWCNPLGAAPKALLVDGHVVGLYGGYGEERHRLLVAGLGDGAPIPFAEYRLALPDGSPPPTLSAVASTRTCWPVRSGTG
jgi:hypothetical protein